MLVFGDLNVFSATAFIGGVVVALTLLEMWQPGSMDGGMFSWGRTTKRQRNWVYRFRVVLITLGSIAFIVGAQGS